MAIINKSTNNKCWKRCGEKGTLLHCCREYTLVQPLWRTVWQFLRKLHTEPQYDPAIPLLGIYLDNSKRCMHSCVHRNAIQSSQDMETHTHTQEYYLVLKKNEIMPLAATRMQLESLILSEVSPKEKDKYHMISLICGIWNRAQVKPSTEQRDSQTCGCQGGGERGSLGLIDANYSIWNGWSMRPYWEAQGTLSSLLG